MGTIRMDTFQGTFLIETSPEGTFSQGTFPQDSIGKGTVNRGTFSEGIGKEGTTRMDILQEISPRDNFPGGPFQINTLTESAISKGVHQVNPLLQGDNLFRSFPKALFWKELIKTQLQGRALLHKTTCRCKCRVVGTLCKIRTNQLPATVKIPL
jgi:hypothetical protein